MNDLVYLRVRLCDTAQIGKAFPFMIEHRLKKGDEMYTLLAGIGGYA